MNENLFETQYDVKQKSKIKRFYEKNRTLIFSTTLIIIIIFISLAFYFNNERKKEISLSNDYVTATIYLNNNEKERAINILKKIIFTNNSTYSALSLFLILNENLVKNDEELLTFFNHVLKNKDLEVEIKNLIIFKKALHQSNSVEEKQLLDSLNPLLNSETLWKPHALSLLGDYYFSKKEYIKAREFYTNIMLLKGLSAELYEHSKSQLALISNEK